MMNCFRDLCCFSSIKCRAGSSLHINDLPDSVLIKVLSYLHHVDLHLSVSLVCRRWNTLSYDRDLWREFSQQDYEQGFQGFIDTTTFQRYIMSRIHSHVKCLILSEQGLTLLPFLCTVGLPKLQIVYLPENGISALCRYNQDFSASVRNISRASPVKIYLGKNRPLCCDDSICVDMSRSSESVTGCEDCLNAPTTDWAEVSKRLQEHPERSFVTIITDNPQDCIPVEIWEELYKMRNLKTLRTNLNLSKLYHLSKEEMQNLSRNLITLSLIPYVHQNCKISEMLSYCRSLRSLTLEKVTLRLHIISQSCKNLAELSLSSMFIENVNHLSDIAYHCTKLKKITLVNISANLHHFLKSLAVHCDRLCSLKVESCSFTDESTNMTGLAELLAGCSRLQNLVFHPIDLFSDSFDFTPLVSYHRSLHLKELDVGIMNGEEIILGTDFQPGDSNVVGLPLHMFSCLTELRMSFLETASIELIQTICGKCKNLTFLTLREYETRNSKHHPEYDRSITILDHIHLTKIKCLSLYLNVPSNYCSFPFEQIKHFIKRSPFLEKLILNPVSRDTLESMESSLSLRPNRCFMLADELHLQLLSEVRWKQLVIPQWQNTWKPKMQ